jgi:hypothetical protein
MKWLHWGKSSTVWKLHQWYFNGLKAASKNMGVFMTPINQTPNESDVVVVYTLNIFFIEWVVEKLNYNEHESGCKQNIACQDRDETKTPVSRDRDYIPSWYEYHTKNKCYSMNGDSPQFLGSPTQKLLQNCCMLKPGTWISKNVICFDNSSHLLAICVHWAQGRRDRANQLKVRNLKIPAIWRIKDVYNSTLWTMQS